MIMLVTTRGRDIRTYKDGGMPSNIYCNKAVTIKADTITKPFRTPPAWVVTSPTKIPPTALVKTGIRVNIVQPARKPCCLIAFPSGDLSVLANIHRLPMADISMVIKYELLFFTCDAHWQSEDAKPDSTDAAITGIMPRRNACSESTPLEP